MIRFAGVAIVVGAALASASPAVARSHAPYCAVSRGADIVYESCSFASFEACLAEIRGLGGYCRPNSYFVPPPAREPEQPRRRQSQPR